MIIKDSTENFFIHNGKEKTLEFIEQIKKIANNLNPENIVKDSLGKELNEKEYLNYICKDASELTDYNEWYIALENVLYNLHEVYYKLDESILDLAKDAFNSANNKFNWEINMKTIDSLKK